MTGLAGLEYAGARAASHEWAVVAAPGPSSLGEALTLVAALAALVLGAWLTGGTSAALLAYLPGRLGAAAGRMASAWAPAVSRRFAAALVGAALGSSLSVGAAAADPGPTLVTRGVAVSPGFVASTDPTPAVPGSEPTVFPQTSAPAPARDLAGPGWTPSRPVERPQASPELVASGGRRAHAGHIVVHRGDTLWAIVRRHLGPGATDVEVASAWPVWHEANRSVIGADPDLLRPGQVLTAPASAQPGAWR